jgi:hypothetical protein
LFVDDDPVGFFLNEKNDHEKYATIPRLSKVATLIKAKLKGRLRLDIVIVLLRITNAVFFFEI